MSIVNKMLRELDRRHATEAAGAAPAAQPGAGFGKHLRPVKHASSAPAIWALGAGLVVVAVALGAWLAWNLAPRWQIVEPAPGVAAPPPRPMPAAPPAPAPAPAEASPVAPPADEVAGTVPSGAPAPMPEPAAAPPPPVAPARVESARELPKPDMFQLATQLTLAVPERERRKAAVAAPAPVKPETRAAPRTPAAASIAVAPSRTSEPVQARIERRPDASPRERADAEYRRAMVLVNGGRLSEGLEGVRAALALDPAHETARRTLVSLLFDARRLDEARGVLQEGLALDPSNIAFAMLLSRILTERGDVAGALAVLQKHAAAGQSSADYRAFAGALLQRVGRHADAIAEYQAALRIAPASGVWWVGLGISLQSAERPREALEAFRRARATGGLNPELAAFAEQRIRQLQ